MITYVDTSTLLKLFVEEPGSDRAETIWVSAEVIASVALIAAEARAALAAARRDGRLTAKQHAGAVAELDLLLAGLHLVQVTEELIAQAAQLAEDESLRGCDAVHLGAALTVGATILSSADTQLCAAAGRRGLHVANPLASS